jgi:hypothetical protein
MMKLVITSEGEQIRQAFLKESLAQKKKEAEATMNESMRSLNEYTMGTISNAQKLINGMPDMATMSPGRNRNNEYKSFLNGGSTNQSPRPGGGSFAFIDKQSRGGSMIPQTSRPGGGITGLGPIREINVAKP